MAKVLDFYFSPLIWTLIVSPSVWGVLWFVDKLAYFKVALAIMFLMLIPLSFTVLFLDKISKRQEEILTLLKKV